jgi:hypothetical protein
MGVLTIILLLYGNNIPKTILLHPILPRFPGYSPAELTGIPSVQRRQGLDLSHDPRAGVRKEPH